MRSKFGVTVFSLSLPALSVAAQPNLKANHRETSASLPVAVSYIRDSSVYVLPQGGKPLEWWVSAKSISDLAISPDASALAFTMYSKRPGSIRSVRHVAVLDSKGTKPRVLDSIPGDNSYGPIWSPDSKRLMFNHFTQGKWRVAVVSREGSGFQVLASPSGGDPVIHCAAWAEDGASLYAYDSTYLYRIGLDGKEMSRLPFSDLSLTLPTTGGKIAFSPGGSKLLVEVEDGDTPGSETRVIICDLKTKQKVDFTSTHGEVSNPSWLPDGEAILFSATSKGHRGIYRKELSTGVETLVVANAASPSISGLSRQ